MPNLLPNWTLTLPWDLGDFNTREAGRLIWSIVLLIIGIAIVITLIKPPKLKRPFSTKVGVALFPVIIVGTLLLGKLIPSFQRTIVLIGMGVLVLHMFLMIASRKPRDPEQVTTWSEAFAGAVGTFALMAVAYAIVPHEFLTFANADLEWGDSSKFIFQSGHEILGFLPVNWPFTMDYPALRDIVVTMIYVVVLGLNLKLFVMWQDRHQVAAATDDDAPPKRSRFGRPLRKSAPAAAVTEAEPVPAGATPRGPDVARTDANPPMPDFATDYVLQEVDPAYLTQSVKPKQFLHIDQAECILCEGCVDICPWKCIHMVSVDAIAEAVSTERPGEDPHDNVAFIVDEDVCTRCALCVDRCPTGVIILGKISPDIADGDPHVRTNRHGYSYGVRF